MVAAALEKMLSEGAKLGLEPEMLSAGRMCRSVGEDERLRESVRSKFEGLEAVVSLINCLGHPEFTI